MAKKAETKTKPKLKAAGKAIKTAGKAAAKLAKPAPAPAKKPAPAKEKAKAAPVKPLKPVAKLESKAKADPKAESKSKPDAKFKVEVKSKADAKAKPEAKSKAEASAKSEAKPVEHPVQSDPKGSGPGTGRKGITIVAPKPMKRMPTKPPAHSYIPASVGRLMDPKNPIRRPLIPSGPKAANVRPLSLKGEDGGGDGAKAKSPFSRKELEKYRQILIKKRAELVGDVATMENEALRGESGSLSNMPQHLAEQGSEAYDQSLSLDLAAADRKLIREIDEAMKRLEAGTFGVCELTGKPISLERLEELPWARYSIEAAREMERQHIRG